MLALKLTGRFKMAYFTKSQSSNETKPQSLENDIDRAEYNFYPNSAYRYAKQQGFLTGEDVLKSLETSPASS
jgi:hypothetical protein